VFTDAENKQIHDYLAKLDPSREEEWEQFDQHLLYPRYRATIGGATYTKTYGTVHATPARVLAYYFMINHHKQRIHEHRNAEDLHKYPFKVVESVNPHNHAVYFCKKCPFPLVPREFLSREMWGTVPDAANNFVILQVPIEFTSVPPFSRSSLDSTIVGRITALTVLSPMPFGCCRIKQMINTDLCGTGAYSLVKLNHDNDFISSVRSIAEYFARSDEVDKASRDHFIASMATAGDPTEQEQDLIKSCLEKFVHFNSSGSPGNESSEVDYKSTSVARLTSELHNMRLTSTQRRSMRKTKSPDDSPKPKPTWARLNDAIFVSSRSRDPNKFGSSPSSSNFFTADSKHIEGNVNDGNIVPPRALKRYTLSHSSETWTKSSSQIHASHHEVLAYLADFCGNLRLNGHPGYKGKYAGAVCEMLSPHAFLAHVGPKNNQKKTTSLKHVWQSMSADETVLAYKQVDDSKSSLGWTLQNSGEPNGRLPIIKTVQMIKNKISLRKSLKQSLKDSLRLSLKKSSRTRASSDESSDSVSGDEAVAEKMISGIFIITAISPSVCELVHISHLPNVSNSSRSVLRSSLVSSSFHTHIFCLRYFERNLSSVQLELRDHFQHQIPSNVEKYNYRYKDLVFGALRKTEPPAPQSSYKPIKLRRDEGDLSGNSFAQTVVDLSFCESNGFVKATATVDATPSMILSYCYTALQLTTPQSTSKVFCREILEVVDPLHLVLAEVNVLSYIAPREYVNNVFWANEGETFVLALLDMEEEAGLQRDGEEGTSPLSLSFGLKFRRRLVRGSRTRFLIIEGIPRCDGFFSSQVTALTLLDPGGHARLFLSPPKLYRIVAAEQVLEIGLIEEFFNRDDEVDDAAMRTFADSIKAREQIHTKEEEDLFEDCQKFFNSMCVQYGDKFKAISSPDVNVKMAVAYIERDHHCVMKAESVIDASAEEVLAHHYLLETREKLRRSQAETGLLVREISEVNEHHQVYRRVMDFQVRGFKPREVRRKV